MATRADKCPVCSGAGQIQDWRPTETAVNTKICHGCDGKGWVEVRLMPSDLCRERHPYKPWRCSKPKGHDGPHLEATDGE